MRRGIIAAALLAATLLLRDRGHAVGLACRKCSCPYFVGNIPWSCTTCGHLYRDHTG